METEMPARIGWSDAEYADATTVLREHADQRLAHYDGKTADRTQINENIIAYAMVGADITPRQAKQPEAMIIAMLQIIKSWNVQGM
jgi:hypothetical protein